MDPAKLAERLRGIVSGSPRREAPPPPTDSTAAVALPIDVALGGEWRALPEGRCFVVERRLDGGSSHGVSTLARFASDIGEGLPSAALLAGVADPRTPLLFFDLETTGLSGGAGTYAFLIGCGWFEPGGAFATRQYVLTRLSDERAVLHAFAGELARAGALVSFNGRTFDAPVLETRYLYHRQPWPGAAVPHLDMLPPARRFWGGGAGASCSLGALEHRILGASRTGDVPGFEIPARYFQFLRSGDASPLAAVLEHNRLDLLSLAGVTARLLSAVHRGRADDAGEALALGRVYARAGVHARAETAFRRAVALAAPDPAAGPFAVEALRALARGARHRRRFDEAAEWWREVLRSPCCLPEAAREAHEALAIHHEHRLRDLESARRFAQRILEEPIRPAWADAARHRLARIERKIGLLDLAESEELGAKG